MTVPVGKWPHKIWLASPDSPARYLLPAHDIPTREDAEELARDEYDKPRHLWDIYLRPSPKCDIRFLKLKWQSQLDAHAIDGEVTINAIFVPRTASDKSDSWKPADSVRSKANPPSMPVAIDTDLCPISARERHLYEHAEQDMVASIRPLTEPNDYTSELVKFFVIVCGGTQGAEGDIDDFEMSMPTHLKNEELLRLFHQRFEVLLKSHRHLSGFDNLTIEILIGGFRDSGLYDLKTFEELQTPHTGKGFTKLADFARHFGTRNRLAAALFIFVHGEHSNGTHYENMHEAKHALARRTIESYTAPTKDVATRSKRGRTGGPVSSDPDPSITAPRGTVKSRLKRRKQNRSKLNHHGLNGKCRSQHKRVKNTQNDPAEDRISSQPEDVSEVQPEDADSACVANTSQGARNTHIRVMLTLESHSPQISGDQGLISFEIEETMEPKALLTEIVQKIEKKFPRSHQLVRTKVYAWARSPLPAGSHRRHLIEFPENFYGTMRTFIEQQNRGESKDAYVEVHAKLFPMTAGFKST